MAYEFDVKNKKVLFSNNVIRNWLCFKIVLKLA